MNNTSMQSIELREYVRPLLKWWWLLAISALLAGVTSAVYVMRQPSTYRSSTTLMVGTALFDPNPNSGELNLSSQLAAGYAEMANRVAIREATQEALGLTWLPNYTTRVIPGTQLIEIAVVDTSPIRAQAVAQTLAEQLILASPGGHSDQGHQAFIDKQLADIEAGIDDTNSEKDRIEQELTQMFSARQIADAKSQIAALEIKLATLQSNYASLLSNSNRGATNTISIIESANLPQKPMQQQLLSTVLISAIVGLALAGAGAYAIEYFEDSIQDQADATRTLNLPALGTISKVRSHGTDSNGLMTEPDVRSPVTDAYASLRMNVFAAAGDSPPESLLITSTAKGEGKSTVAANFAIELARSGRKVILVDADLHRPAQQRLFGLDNRTGISTYLQSREVHLASVVKETRIPGLLVLTSGPLLPNPTPLLSRRQMREMLAEIGEHADIVIVDTPPITATADASILSPYVDGVLLVVAAGRTGRRLALRAAQSLRQLNAPLLGYILYDVPLRQSYYPLAAYGYGSTKRRRSVNPDQTFGRSVSLNSLNTSGPAPSAANTNGHHVRPEVTADST